MTAMLSRGAWKEEVIESSLSWAYYLKKLCVFIIKVLFVVFGHGAYCYKCRKYSDVGRWVVAESSKEMR